MNQYLQYIIDEYAFCNIKTGEIASNIITYVDIDVEKMYQTGI